MRKIEEMTDYEKAIVEVAAKIHTAELSAALISDEEFAISESINEAIIDASMLVDGVIEMTRGKNGKA